MTVKELIKILDSVPDKDKQILVACDEEWNTLFEGIEVNKDNDTGRFVIFGLSGSEV